jgi:hypothetical protein
LVNKTHSHRVRDSLYKISNTLQVNNAAFKDKMALSGMHACCSYRPVFFEFPAMQSPTPPESIIEMEKSRGEKIRIRLSRKVDLDLSALVKEFWVERFCSKCKD